jgi:hypothetical protein
MLALRFNNKLIINIKPFTYYSTITYLINQCQPIMAKKPEEETACLQIIEACEEMLRIIDRTSQFVPSNAIGVLVTVVLFGIGLYLLQAC